MSVGFVMNRMMSGDVDTRRHRLVSAVCDALMA
jgi:hypothetical protein